ncbi:VOC family protein [Candidatus Uabimicrobium amorphum]|uniref:VOC family protein n=1 Tax=Uabimicrobium amorphum TaxID=2596890 RepID=A0A5S9F282_UABAM|nr:VOC family protein [Candidatus Uabimicrobium amorphum]BBM82114.1 VOC family protein [Candidatus Uabimicrobium amorphum]
MKALTPYLTFDGNAREAMEFYHSCFGGELDIRTFDEAPGGSCPGGDSETMKDKVMHACLTLGDFILMASDSPQGGTKNGDSVHLSINCENREQTDKLFEALGEGGNVTMPLQDTFWGAYFGMVVDQYGFHWMLHQETQQK